MLDELQRKMVDATQAIPVLDKGFIRLIDSMPAWSSLNLSCSCGHPAMSHPLDMPCAMISCQCQKFVEGLGAGDKRIVQAARVSYGAGTKSVREDSGLIKYLIKNQHTTPLEKVRFEFHVKLPISCARQWIRHRTGSFNEVSTRYSEVEEDEFYLPDLKRMQAQDTSRNRQGSADPLPEEIAERCRHRMDLAARHSYEMYRLNLQDGLAREVARGSLILDTYTQWYWTVDLNNLFKFLGLRMEEHAQWEMRQYAKAVLELARPIAPVAFKAWEESNDVQRT